MKASQFIAPLIIATVAACSTPKSQQTNADNTEATVWVQDPTTKNSAGLTTHAQFITKYQNKIGYNLAIDSVFVTSEMNGYEAPITQSVAFRAPHGEYTSGQETEDGIFTTHVDSVHQNIGEGRIVGAGIEPERVQ